MRFDRLFDLSGRVAIITGGAGLLGREYVLALAGMGAHVVVADTDAEAGATALAAVSAQVGANATFMTTDVSSKLSVQETVKRTIAEHGHIDILINNAALDPKFEPETASEFSECFEDFPLMRWERSLAVDLTGMFLCSQAVAEPMLKGNGGVIVNVSSIYGVVGPDQRIYDTRERAFKPVTYSVTKSGALGLTRYLATYWAGKNIRVNSLTLGGVYNDHDDEFVRRYSDRTPMGRMADRREYCGAMLFLVSDASSYMTGANLVVDGGWTAW